MPAKQSCSKFGGWRGLMPPGSHSFVGDLDPEAFMTQVTEKLRTVIPGSKVLPTLNLTLYLIELSWVEVMQQHRSATHRPFDLATPQTSITAYGGLTPFVAVPVVGFMRGAYKNYFRKRTALHTSLLARSKSNPGFSMENFLSDTDTKEINELVSDFEKRLEYNVVHSIKGNVRDLINEPVTWRSVLGRIVTDWKLLLIILGKGAKVIPLRVLNENAARLAYVGHAVAIYALGYDMGHTIAEYSHGQSNYVEWIRKAKNVVKERQEHEARLARERQEQEERLARERQERRDRKGRTGRGRSGKNKTKERIQTALKTSRKNRSNRVTKRRGLGGRQQRTKQKTKTPADMILNPETGRYVKKTGKIGQKLLLLQTNTARRSQSPQTKPAAKEVVSIAKQIEKTVSPAQLNAIAKKQKDVEGLGEFLLNLLGYEDTRRDRYRAYIAGIAGVALLVYHTLSAYGHLGTPWLLSRSWPNAILWIARIILGTMGGTLGPFLAAGSALGQANSFTLPPPVLEPSDTRIGTVYNYVMYWVDRYGHDFV